MGMPAYYNPYMGMPGPGMLPIGMMPSNLGPPNPSEAAAAHGFSSPPQFRPPLVDATRAHSLGPPQSSPLSPTSSTSHGPSRAATLRPTSNSAPVVNRPPSEPGRPLTTMPSSGSTLRRPSSNSRPLPPLTQPSTPGGHPVNKNDNIKVVVRVRPMNEREIFTSDATVVQVDEQDPQQMQVIVPGLKGSVMTRNFTFHGCLAPTSKQSDVLKICGITQLLNAAMAGYHATIFAYGQTGSGKTYTMSGHEDIIDSDGYAGDTDDGIVTRSVMYLFDQMQKANSGCKYTFRASYCEIYNEALYDLLKFTKQQLQVRWDSGKGFYVPELAVKECTSVEDMLEVISRGMKHRKMGSHELNLESSRSHSIMTVYIDAVTTSPEDHDYGIPKFGKVSFVDLAGSERLKDTKSAGEMLKETANINKSLFTLGKVISALADMQGTNMSSVHIPYRDSKLTKLLMDSLGGNALALMIACCSPSSQHVEETLSTLSYATRAKNIRNKPMVALDPQEAQIAALKRELFLLRQENVWLRDQIMPGTQLPSGMVTPLHGRTTAGSRPLSSQSDTTGSSHSVARPDFHALLPQGSAVHSPRGNAEESAASSAASGLTVLPASRSSKDMADRVGKPAAAAGSAAPLDQLPAGELARKLAESQQMIARFSRENERLANQNEQLTGSKQIVANDYKGALDEVDWLRNKLERLETSISAMARTAGGAPSEGGAAGTGPQPSGQPGQAKDYRYDNDIKGALTSLLRTFSADDGDSETTSKGDKIAAVARDGADQRPVSATPSTLGGAPPGRRQTKQDVGLEAGAVGERAGQ
ncbi:MAG: Kif12 type kinesin [Trebouxia sp. A1-2]|nr:MAG: Kif12 type kinesin [Trebouxia sp. A1-2]